MKKVLITGGAGFLGLHLALGSAKRKEKYNLVLTDIADFEKSEYPKNVTFVKADVRDKTLMEEYIKKVDYIIHAAAALPLWKKEEIFSINVGGTKTLLELSLKHKIKRFIYISSTAVYGVPKKHPIYENDKLVGVGPYGASKIQAEKLCFKYIKKGLNVTIIRPKTFVGTYRLGVFEILFDWVHDGKKIPVIGSGNNRYQLLDVEDLVDAIYLFLEKREKGEFNDVFNVGAEKFGTVKEDLQALFDFAKSGSKVLPTPAFLVKPILALFYYLKLSPLYPWVYATADKDSYVSIDKIKKVLKWKPKYSNADALIKAYKWYLKHYKEVKSHDAGVTHRVGWKQGILSLVKKMM